MNSRRSREFPNETPPRGGEMDYYSSCMNTNKKKHLNSRYDHCPAQKLAHARSGARRVDRCLRFLSRSRVKAKQRTQRGHRELYDGECNDVVAIHRQFPARVPKEVHCRWIPPARHLYTSLLSFALYLIRKANVHTCIYIYIYLHGSTSLGTQIVESGEPVQRVTACAHVYCGHINPHHFSLCAHIGTSPVPSSVSGIFVYSVVAWARGWHALFTN